MSVPRLSFPALLATLLLSLLAPGLAQSSNSQTVLTIDVAAPTKAKDVQVRYYFGGETSIYSESAATPSGDNKILIKTGPDGKWPTSLKLVAYAPGCQLVTISVADLTSNSQGAFQCTPLNTIQFLGHADTSAFPGKSLQAQVLYECNWCPKFFGLTSGSISPFSLGKADIGSDGAFTISLPDFTADPLYSTVANDASLFFYVVDGKNGEPIGALKPSLEGLPKEGAVKVAADYPQIDFTVQTH